jgi:mannose/fructose/sorbose-specific phosphotransferase system IIA component
LSDYGVLIVAHGSLAEGFIEAASMIVGKTENTKAVCFDSTQGVEGLEKVVQAALDQFTNCDGVLCLVDIPGGSPARVVAAQSYKYKGVEIISGVSLPMVIEVLFAREDQSLKELYRLEWMVFWISVQDCMRVRAIEPGRASRVTRLV